MAPRNWVWTVLLFLSSSAIIGCGPGDTTAPSDDANQTAPATSTDDAEPAPLSSLPATPTTDADRDSAFIPATGNDESASDGSAGDSGAVDAGASGDEGAAADDGSSDETLSLGNPAPDTAATADGTRLEQADVGVGKKGRGYGGDPITEPAKQYFSIRERVVFQAQIPQAMNMYKALHGNLPKTHDDFMKEIIEANNIELPELPKEKAYLYDPEQGELLVQTGGKT